MVIRAGRAGGALLFRYMQAYSNEENLILTKQVGITKEVYEILRREKKKQGISMAKIICNTMIKQYGE